MIRLIFLILLMFAPSTNVFANSNMPIEVIKITDGDTVKAKIGKSIFCNTL